MRGRLESEGEIHVHGVVSGEIIAPGLALMADGYVRGTIVSKELRVDGYLRGRATARNVGVGPGATIEGQIFHHNIDVEKGARVDARFPWRPVNYFEEVDQQLEQKGRIDMAKFMRSDKESRPEGADAAESDSAAASGPVQHPAPANRPGKSGEPSIISGSLKVTGNLESDAEIRVDGVVEGDVRAKTVTIGEGANIVGSVYGETVNVSGTVEGKIEGRSVVVSKSAHTTGDIVHETLEVEAGAYVDGHCRPGFGRETKTGGLGKPQSSSASSSASSASSTSPTQDPKAAASAANSGSATTQPA